MELIRELGGRLIAAPPAGAVDGDKLNLDAVAERYTKLLEVGRARDCAPQLEVWGFSKNFSRLSEVLYVLAAVQDPDACILPDVYHLYKGGSNFADVATLAGEVTHVLHMNDYPDIPRDKINDSDRVYPGDGIAPVPSILRILFNNGFRGVLSLELFNRNYWKLNPEEVASTGLAKMKAAVAAASA
jgi:sugar phosphate isomerase/epimerase